MFFTEAYKDVFTKRKEKKIKKAKAKKEEAERIKQLELQDMQEDPNFYNKVILPRLKK